jgi:hypothetical protein
MDIKLIAKLLLVKTQQAVEIRMSSRVKYWMLGLNDR